MKDLERDIRRLLAELEEIGVPRNSEELARRDVILRKIDRLRFEARQLRLPIDV